MIKLPLPTQGHTWPSYFTPRIKQPVGLRHRRKKVPFFTVVADYKSASPVVNKVLVPMVKYIEQNILEKMQLLLSQMQVSINAGKNQKSTLTLPELTVRELYYVHREILPMSLTQQRKLLKYIKSIKISGRSLDMFLVETLRLKTISYTLYDRNGTFYLDAPGTTARFYLTASYRVMLKKYTKTFFDCFARGTQIYINNKAVAIGQFLFFKWAQKYCVYEFFYRLLAKKNQSLAPRTIKKIIQPALVEYKNACCTPTCLLTPVRKKRYASTNKHSSKNAFALIQEHLSNSKQSSHLGPSYSAVLSSDGVAAVT